MCKWADDSQRLILENFDIIQDSPSKIYHEAVPFSPSSSWLHEWYSPEALQGVKVVKGLQAGWGACSRTVLLDSIPHVLAYWNNLIATGLASGNIILLDATTGTCTSTLSGHKTHINSLAFSSDGMSLISAAAGDTTVKLWDIQTGGIARTFYGDTSDFLSVSISSDCATIALGSYDHMIYLWDTQTGECCHVIAGHKRHVNSVNFSPINPQLLISASHDNTVQQWDINGHKIGPAYEGYHVAFSPVGTHFVSWGGGVIVVQNSDSGVIITKLRAPSSGVEHCCFIPNGKFIAGASGNTIYIWDITSSNPHPIKTMVGHTGEITSIAFSPTLISSSLDKSIKFWPINILPTIPLVDNSEYKLLTSTPIMSVSVQAKDHIAISSDEAGVVRTWDISTGICRASIQTLAGPLSQRGARLIDGRLLFVWCTPKKIYIWDTETEKQPKKLGARSNFSTTSLKISEDGSIVFLLDSEHIQALSTQTGELVGKVRLDGKLSNNPLTVDGLRVWVCFDDISTQGWDFGITGPTSIGPSNAPLASPHLDFIHGTTVGTITYPSKIKDKATGQEIFQLPQRYEGFTALQCDGQYLVAGYKSGELLVLDFGQMIS